MEILSQLFGFVIIVAFFLFSYIAIHMVFEKDAKKYIPLIWEKGGWYYNWKHRNDSATFDKSKIKYRDGDNT